MPILVEFIDEKAEHSARRWKIQVYWLNYTGWTLHTSHLAIRCHFFRRFASLRWGCLTGGWPDEPPSEARPRRETPRATRATHGAERRSATSPLWVVCIFGVGFFGWIDTFFTRYDGGAGRATGAKRGLGCKRGTGTLESERNPSQRKCVVISPPCKPHKKTTQPQEAPCNGSKFYGSFSFLRPTPTQKTKQTKRSPTPAPILGGLFALHGILSRHRSTLRVGRSKPQPAAARARAARGARRGTPCDPPGGGP